MNFDTGNVTRMGGMFDGCSSLTDADLSNFSIGEYCSLEDMFIGCASLQSLRTPLSVLQKVALPGAYSAEGEVYLFLPKDKAASVGEILREGQQSRCQRRDCCFL